MAECRHCGSVNTKKNGSGKWGQRYYCKDCKRTFTLNKPRFSNDTKFKAVELYLNNTGIRKTAMFLKTSPTTIERWIKNAHKILIQKLKEYDPLKTEQSDIIELDEIYTYINTRKKRPQYGLLILEEESVLLHMSSDKD